jgi:hypothetical protein
MKLTLWQSGADGSESHDCSASFIYCVVEGLPTPREELGIHYPGHNPWVLAERKSVMSSIRSAGAGGLILSSLPRLVVGVPFSEFDWGPSREYRLPMRFY